VAILLADAVATQQVGTKLPLDKDRYDKSRTDWPEDLKLDTTKKAGGERDSSLMIYVSSLLCVCGRARVLCECVPCVHLGPSYVFFIPYFINVLSRG
jgi:hypothetical protein